MLRAFGNAVAAGSVEALEAFVATHEQTPLAAVARTRAERLRFEAAGASGDPEAWKAFFALHPASPLRVAAVEKLAQAAFEEAAAADTAEAYEGMLARYPTGTPADHARARLASLRARTIAVQLEIGPLRYKTVRPEEVRQAFARVLGAKFDQAGLAWEMLAPEAPASESQAYRYRLRIEYEETEGTPYAQGRGTNITARLRLVERETGRILWSRDVFGSTSATATFDPTALYESLRRDAVDAFWKRFERRVDVAAWNLDAAPTPRVTFREPTYRMRVQDNWAYVGGESRLFVVDVHAPLAPRIVATLPVGGRVRDLSVPGRYAYATVEDPVDGSARLVVMDLQIPAAPRRLGALVLDAPSGALVDHGGKTLVERRGQVLRLPDGPPAEEVQPLGSLRLPAPVRDIAVVDETVLALAGDTIYAFSLDALAP